MRTIRVWFSKTGDSAYISHLDLQRVMHRALAKARIPAWYSLGYNPHIYITFALPLPLGQESVCEAMDFRTEDDSLEGDTVLYGLNGALPLGIRVYNVTLPVHEARDITAARYLIRLPDVLGLREAFHAYNESTEAIVSKIGKKDGQKAEKKMDLKEFIPRLDYMELDAGPCLDLVLPAGSSVNVNPALLLNYLQQTCGVDVTGASICRTKILMKDGELFC